MSTYFRSTPLVQGVYDVGGVIEHFLAFGVSPVLTAGCLAANLNAHEVPVTGSHVTTSRRTMRAYEIWRDSPYMVAPTLNPDSMQNYLARRNEFTKARDSSKNESLRRMYSEALESTEMGFHMYAAIHDASTRVVARLEKGQEEITTVRSAIDANALLTKEIADNRVRSGVSHPALAAWLQDSHLRSQASVTAHEKLGEIARDMEHHSADSAEYVSQATLRIATAVYTSLFEGVFLLNPDPDSVQHMKKELTVATVGIGVPIAGFIAAFHNILNRRDKITRMTDNELTYLESHRKCVNAWLEMAQPCLRLLEDLAADRA